MLTAPDPFWRPDGSKFFRKNGPSGLSWRWTTCQLRQVWKIRVDRACESSGLEAAVSAPLFWVLLPVQRWAVDTAHSSHMILVSLCRSLALSLFLSHTQAEELRPLPSSNPGQQVLYYHARSFFLFFPPCLLLLVSVWAECVCLVLSRSECLVITQFTTSKEWSKFTLGGGRRTNANKDKAEEKDAAVRRKDKRLNKREKLMFSVLWSMCWVRLAARPSDWVTENRCEHNLQLPPSAKQHHQSWQGLHWVAVHNLNCRETWLD